RQLPLPSAQRLSQAQSSLARTKARRSSIVGTNPVRAIGSIRCRVVPFASLIHIGVPGIGTRARRVHAQSENSRRDPARNRTDRHDFYIANGKLWNKMQTVTRIGPNSSKPRLVIDVDQSREFWNNPAACLRPR